MRLFEVPWLQVDSTWLEVSDHPPLNGYKIDNSITPSLLLGRALIARRAVQFRATIST